MKTITSFDIEGTGFSPFHGAEIFSYCIGTLTHDGDCNVIVRRVDTKNKKFNQESWEILKDYFLDPTKIKVIHNLKFELHFLKHHKIEIHKDTIFEDTMIMSRMLRNLAPSHTLDYLVWELCGRSRELGKKISKLGKILGNYQKIPVPLMTKYQIRDGEDPLLLYKIFKPEFEKDEVLNKDYLNEIEVIKATQIEETIGVKLHENNIKMLKKDLMSKLDKVMDDTFNLIGEYINLNSDDVIRRLFYKKFNFNILRYTKGDNPIPATDKDTITELCRFYTHSIFDLILQQRSYTKALSMIKSYEKLADKNRIIHPNLNTNAARTGRKTSTKPNLQNVSKKSAIKNKFPVPLRKCFCPQPGYVFILVDFSGIEMRLIVNNTREPELFDLLIENPDTDLHHLTLECFKMDGLFQEKGDFIFNSGIENARILKEKDIKLYKVERGGFKNTGFAIAYGGGSDRVADMNMKTIEEITEGEKNYRNRFQRISNFTNDLITQVKQYGYIITALGRKLYVPRDKPYIGSNYSIQGTAAQIHKRAQVKVQNLFDIKFKNKNLNICLDVHDELVLHYPRNLLKYRNEILPEVNNLMIDVPELDVELRTEFSIASTSWNEKQDLEICI